jgi:hypothetical protein
LPPPSPPLRLLRYDRPTIKLAPDQLKKEISQVAALIRAAEADAAATAASAHGADAAAPKAAAAAAAPQLRWFRPGCGWFDAAVLAEAEQAGCTTVLGTVFPYDTHSKVPVINALYCWLKAYCGAIIVLHDGNTWVAVAHGSRAGRSHVA